MTADPNFVRTQTKTAHQHHRSADLASKVLSNDVGRGRHVHRRKGSWSHSHIGTDDEMPEEVCHLGLEVLH